MKKLVLTTFLLAYISTSSCSIVGEYIGWKTPDLNSEKFSSSGLEQITSPSDSTSYAQQDSSRYSFK